jgi:hypothetical protein
MLSILRVCSIGKELLTPEILSCTLFRLGICLSVNEHSFSRRWRGGSWSQPMKLSSSRFTRLLREEAILVNQLTCKMNMSNDQKLCVGTGIFYFILFFILHSNWGLVPLGTAILAQNPWVDN